MTDLAKLVVRLEAETSKYMAGMEKAQQKLARFEGSTTRALNKIRDQILGAFTVKKIIEWGQSSIDAADKMGKLAQSTGIAVDVISEVGYAAELSNISNEELAKTMQKLASSAVDATKAGSAQEKAFKALGVTVTDASGQLKETDQILLDVADRFSQLEDGAQKAALAEDIFGKNAQKLIPFLNQGRAGIEALRAEAKRLGVSLTDEAAKAAGEFNDNMTRLNKAASGVAATVTQKLLPYLIDLTETLLEVANDGETLQTTIDGVVVVFKTFATVAIAVNTVLQVIGKSIGATIGLIDTFDFKATDFLSPILMVRRLAMNAEKTGAAVEAMKGTFSDIGDVVGKNVQRVTDLWTDADSKLREVNVTAEKLKETLGGIGGGDIVQEIDIQAKKIERSPVDQLLDDFDERTKTSFDKAQDLYNEEKEMLEQLLAAKRISIDEYNERISESFDKFLPQFDVTVEKIKDKTKKATDELTEYQKEVQRNTVDILATGLENALDEGISKGADDALAAFGDMIEKMVLQAIAADIAGALFGDPKTGKGGFFDFASIFGGKSAQGEGGSSGFGDFIGSIFGGLFGGTRDSGGRGKRGYAYKIGTGAQPEMFVPDSEGEFIPRNEWMRGSGGGGNSSVVNQTLNFTGRADAKTARQHQVEAARQQRIATSRLG